ncbi:hypothetical protein [Leifsonia sp. A12D58]|uniref:hypothetical protein n=1 Tax=Leifsonia sp. A12D58 TaxID=3397674 RepID=UPI0039DF8378
MATRWARVARGWIVAVFSTFVAALSHTLGGGSAPGLLAVVLSLAFAGILCIGLAGRTLSLWRLGLSVALSQLIFHGLFSLGTPGGALATQAVSEQGVGAHQHQIVTGLVSSSDALTTVGVPVHGMFAHDAGMWIAHSAAALLTIVALRHGERAFWSLFSSAVLAIRSLWEPLAPLAVPGIGHGIPVTARVFLPRALSTLLSTMRHRGPPVSLRAAQARFSHI